MIKLNERKLDSYLRNATKSILETYQRDFKTVTITWKSDVDSSIVGNKLLAVGKDWKVWFYVDRGTEPHSISVKNADFLKIPTAKYRPKTKPVAKVQGVPYFNSGVEGFWFTKEVKKHPGSKAREFTNTWVKKNRNKSTALINKAVMKSIVKEK